MSIQHEAPAFLLAVPVECLHFHSEEALLLIAHTFGPWESGPVLDVHRCTVCGRLESRPKEAT